MLTRADQPDADKRERAKKKREYRHLIAGGGAVLDGLRVVDINALTEAVIELQWLPENQSEDRAALIAAIGRLLDDLASRYRR